MHINELRNHSYRTLTCLVCGGSVEQGWVFQQTAMCLACAIGGSDEAWIKRLEMELDADADGNPSG